MSELQIFENSEFGKLSVIEIDGKPYFPASDCARILGHENPARAVRKYCKGVTEMVTPSNGGIEHTNVHTYWTQKGRIFLYDLLKSDGIYPLMENSMITN